MDKSLRKDNTGYDLKQLFVGSEGTLGYISAVSIFCAQKPRSTNAVLIACSENQFKNVLDVFQVARNELNEVMSAFEFMDKESLICIKENLKLENPFSNEIANKCQFYCLVETQGSSDEHNREKLSKFFERLMSNKLCNDAIIAENMSQVKQLWSLRENIAPGLNRDGYTYKYDISLPLKPMYDIVLDLRKRLTEQNNKNFIRCVGYGHVGDGNLHLNITSRKADEKIESMLEPFIFEWTSKYHGSISAEHGIGLNKAKYLKYSKSFESIELMKKFKNLLDPKLIFNPYKVLI